MSDNEVPVSERIKILFQHFGDGNLSAFAREIGVSAQAIRDLMKGEKGGPSWPVLQNILRAFPSVSTDWLVLGRGPMLQNVEDVNMVILKPIYASYEQFLESLQKTEEYTSLATERLASTHPEVAQRIREEHATATAKQQALMRIYSVSDRGALNTGLLLSDRLSISGQDALDLVLSGKLRGTLIGESYRVTEQAVREFLGEV